MWLRGDAVVGVKTVNSTKHARSAHAYCIPICFSFIVFDNGQCGATTMNLVQINHAENIEWNGQFGAAMPINHQITMVFVRFDYNVIHHLRINHSFLILTFLTVTSHWRISRLGLLWLRFGFLHNGEIKWIDRAPLCVPCHFKSPNTGSFSPNVHRILIVSDCKIIAKHRIEYNNLYCDREKTVLYTYTDFDVMRIACFQRPTKLYLCMRSILCSLFD